MTKQLEKKFITYCNSENLEINPHQLKVIDKLQSYYNENFKSFFSNFFFKSSSKKGFYISADDSEKRECYKGYFAL